MSPGRGAAAAGHHEEVSGQQSEVRQGLRAGPHGRRRTGAQAGPWGGAGGQPRGAGQRLHYFPQK